MPSLFSLFLLLFALIASTQTDKPSCCLSFCLEIYTILLFGTVYFLIHFFVCFYLFPVYAELFLSFIFKYIYLSFIANHLPFSVFYYFVCSSILSFILNIWLSFFPFVFLFHIRTVEVFRDVDDTCQTRVRGQEGKRRWSRKKDMLSRDFIAPFKHNFLTIIRSLNKNNYTIAFWNKKKTSFIDF